MERSGVIVVVGLLVAVAVAAALLYLTAGVGTTNTPKRAALVGVAVGMGLVVLAAAIVLIAVRRRPARRAGKPAQLAERLGYTYQKAAPKGFCRDWVDLPSIRSAAQGRHLMRGEFDGRPLIVFETMYMIHTGQASIPVTHTVYAVETPVWPTVTVTPRGLAGRLAFKLGRRRGLMLEEPAFNRAFRVRTSDEDFALTMLTPRTQLFLLSKPGVRWHVDHGRLCLIYSGSLRPDRVEASLDRLREFLASIPGELDAWEPA